MADVALLWQPLLKFIPPYVKIASAQNNGRVTLVLRQHVILQNLRIMEIFYEPVHH